MPNEKEVNYTAEQEAILIQQYEAGVPVENLATTFEKSQRSIIAKLSRLGVYKSKTGKNAQPRVTKADLVRDIESILRLEEGTLQTFEKADKAALEAAFKAIAV
jgi:hypothetical protein